MAEQLRFRCVDPSKDSMLKIALAIRLVDPFADAHGDTKLGRALDDVGRSSQRALDSVRFLRSSHAHPGRFNAYEEVRSRLIAAGIPKNEIAFIHDADNNLTKINLFNAVNARRSASSSALPKKWERDE